ncbi:MAG: hypothetical protein ABSD57_11235 [Verrucomicrobiota bacterium]|jgi:hypothetical protein
MRKLLLAILFAATCGITETIAAESPISVSVAIPTRNDERRVEYHDRTTHFHVIVSNTSDKPQRIWREWCSWGYYGLTFEFADENGKKWVAKKKPQVWTRNFPDWWTLDPHESFVIDVYFGDSDTWDGFPLPKDGSQTVTMLAVFEFKPDDESRQHDVWTGRVASKAEKVTFYHWKPETK